jgi:hypothetical protein
MSTCDQAEMLILEVTFSTGSDPIMDKYDIIGMI